MARKQKRNSRPTRFAKPVILAGSVVILLVIIIAALELTHTIHLFHSNTTKTAATIPSTTPATSSPASSSTPSATNSATAITNTSNSKDTGASASSSPSTSGNAPIKPYGDFISNHNPPQNGTSEVSVCYTTPGATCTMTFTNGDQTKSLISQTTDSSGSTSWSWDASILGVNSGHWTVTVTANLNSQTSTASDTMDVGP